MKVSEIVDLDEHNNKCYLRHHFLRSQLLWVFETSRSSSFSLTDSQL